MTQQSLGIAVIGAGMVGRAHAAGYRVASQLYDLDLPEIRLVAIADAHEPFASAAVYRPSMRSKWKRPALPNRTPMSRELVLANERARTSGR